MKSWSLWSTKTKVFWGVVALLIIGGGSAYLAGLRKEAVVPAIAATAAIGALFVTAYSAYSTAARARKKDTLEAWREWSVSSRDARRRLTSALGMEDITKEQGKALAVGDELLGSKGETLTGPEYTQIKDDVRSTLNGLERLAVGVELGIYDEAVLRLMGATIIARTYERFEPFIVALRESESTKQRQSKAYTELSILYQMMEQPRLTEMLQGNQQKVDTARLKALKRN